MCLYWIPCKCCAPIPSDSIRWNIARRLQQWIFIKRWCTSLPMECALQPSSEWASDVKKWEFSYARKAVGNEQKMNVKLAFFSIHRDWWAQSDDYFVAVRFWNYSTGHTIVQATVLKMRKEFVTKEKQFSMVAVALVAHLQNTCQPCEWIICTRGHRIE